MMLTTSLQDISLFIYKQYTFLHQLHELHALLYFCNMRHVI